MLLLKNIYREIETSIASSSRGKRLFFSEWSFIGVYPCLGFDHHNRPTYTKHKTARYCLQGLLVLGIVTIGFPRLCRGHYPSDVLASMILGLAVLQFGILAMIACDFNGAQGSSKHLTTRGEVAF